MYFSAVLYVDVYSFSLFDDAICYYDEPVISEHFFVKL